MHVLLEEFWQVLRVEVVEELKEEEESLSELSERCRRRKFFKRKGQEVVGSLRIRRDGRAPER